MPTVIEERGFKINHVWKAGGVARFVVWDNKVSLYENHGLDERDLQTAGELCVKHYRTIVRKLREMPWVKSS